MKKNKKKESSEKPEVNPSANKVPEKIKPPLLESCPLKLWKDEHGNTQIASHNNDLKNSLEMIVGVKDVSIARHILAEAISAISPRIKDEEFASNIILQSVNDSKPKSALEARLAAQAEAAYTYGMESLQRAGSSECLYGAESWGNLAIKFMRIHNETVETLLRASRGNEQKIVVQHQNVNVNGNAVVGNFNSEEVGVLKNNHGKSP